MPYTQEPMTPTVPLLYSAHQIADEFCQAQANLSKAEQVYLNTLAVYAVHDYLEQLGFSTSLETSRSWNSVTQSMMDVADLEVKDYGRLECRPVLPTVTDIHIPMEVWDDRIGFVAVQINESLDEATLLGFVEKVEAETFSLDQLQPIEELPACFERINWEAASAKQKSMVPSQSVQLSHWLKGQFEAVWQAIEEVLSPPQAELAWSTRGTRRAEGVSRVKVLEVGQDLGQEQIALWLGVTPVTKTESDITVQIRPTGDRIYLPNEVQVRLLTETGAELGQARAAITETIQLQFKAEQGESFSIEVTSGNKQITEFFVL